MLRNHPPLIVFEEDRFRYYEALEKYAENEDIQPLYVFFQYCLEKNMAQGSSAVVAGTLINNKNAGWQLC